MTNRFLGEIDSFEDRRKVFEREIPIIRAASSSYEEFSQNMDILEKEVNEALEAGPTHQFLNALRGVIGRDSKFWVL